MLLSTFFTTGQITFILRVVIQTLSSIGLFIVGLVVLGNAPRIASATTHDVLSRIAGGETATLTSLKWLFKRGKTPDPTNTSKLTLGVALLLSYSLFIKLTDVGLIGLHACTTPSANSLDFPASVKDDVDALALVQGNMVNGTDPKIVKYFRCDAVEPFTLGGDNTTLSACNAWTNSTYADKSVFQGLNLSDTAVLMPRQLMRYNHSSSDVFELNGYFIGPLYQRVSKPTIMNGLAVVPHDTGFRAFLGVPNPTPFTRYTLPQTLAFEAEVGCMTVGMYTEDIVYSMPRKGIDIFSIRPNGPWRKYVGPDYLRDVVSHTVDDVRDYLKPMWNMSTLNETAGFVLGTNISWESLSTAANVRGYFLPILPNGTISDSVDAGMYIFGNCSERLEKHLNISAGVTRNGGDSCNLMGIGGSFIEGGEFFLGLSKMVCATSFQVNLVRADIEVDEHLNITVAFERLPSDLHITMADWWNAVRHGNHTDFDGFDTVYRYALTPNPTGPNHHFIRPDRSRIEYTYGPGGGANAFSRVGGMMLNVRGLDFANQFASLAYLEEKYQAVNFTPSWVTKWSGELGASYILGSSSFNGWAAGSVEGGPITVVSTGGREATCYNPYYALAFVPLLLAFAIAFIMSLNMLFTLDLLVAPRMKELYAGLQPYASILLPGSSQSQSLLVWEYDGQARLEPVENGQAIQVSGAGTAAEHLRRRKGDEQ